MRGQLACTLTIPLGVDGYPERYAAINSVITTHRDGSVKVWECPNFNSLHLIIVSFHMILKSPVMKFACTVYSG
jgi:hypothetical protein